MQKFLLFLLLWICVGHSMSNAQTRYMRAVNNIADLVSAQNNPSQIHTNIWVAGYYTDTDGGGGVFEWVNGSNSATNRGTVLASKYPGAVGRFKRHISGPLNTRMFGAGGGVSNDSVALQEAIDLAAASNNDLYFQPVPGGYLSGNLIARTGLRIQGAASIIISGTNWLSISNVINVDVRDLTVYPTSTNQVAFWLHNDAHDISFRKVFVNGTLDWANRANWKGNGPYGWVIERSYINEWANCSAEFIGTDVWFNSDNSHRNTFNGCSFRNANRYNILASITGHGNNFTGCDIEGAPTFVRATDAELNLLSCYFEAHTNPYGIQVDGTSIVNVQDSYMNDTYVAFGGSSTAASLVLERNHWDGIGSSLTSPFIRYTQDSVSRLKLVNNNYSASVVGYRTGQWWDGAAWQNLSNNEEEIHDHNLIYDPVSLMTRRAYTSGPFLDSQKFNHPIGIWHFPDNSVGLSIKANQLPTNAVATALIALENTTLSAGYYMLGIDGTNQFVIRWAPNTNSNLLNLANDGAYAGFPGNVGVGTLVPNLSPLEFNKALTISAQGNNVVAGLEMRGARTNTTPADFASIKFILNTDTNAVAYITAYKDSTNDAGGLRFFTKASASGLAEALKIDSQRYVILPSIAPLSILRTSTNSGIAAAVIGANMTWDGTTLDAIPGGGGATNALVSINSSTNQAQTIAIGTAGSDFNLVDSAGGVHTINLPPASLTTSGYLTSNNFSIFNLKGTANPANGFIPYLSSSGVFSDSPFKRESVSQVSDNYRAANDFGPSFVFLKQGRTGDATNTPASGAQLGVIGAGGWIGATDTYAQPFRFLTTENWSASGTGMKTEFWTVPTGTSIQALAMVVDQDTSVKTPLLYATGLVNTNYFKRGKTNISTGAANFSAIGPGTGIYTNNANTTITLLSVPTTDEMKFSFITLGDGVSTNGFVCGTHTIEWQTSQINVPTNTQWTTYDFDQVGTKLFAWANGVPSSGSGTSFTTAVGITNNSGVVSWNALAGTNIVFITNAYGVVSINSTASGSSTNGAGVLAFQKVGTGSDHVLTTSYSHVVFGGTGPDFVLTNAGTYQILMTVGAYAANTFPQHYYLTNSTDNTSIAGSAHDININSMEAPLVIAVQYTTTAANKTIQLWGYTDNTSGGTPAVIATKTVTDVLLLQSGSGGGSGSVVGPVTSTDNAIARFDGATGQIIQNSVVTIADTTGNIIIGDASQATVTITGNLSGASDPVLTLANNQINAGLSGFVGGSIDVSAAVAGSATVGGTGAYRINGKTIWYSTTNGYASFAMANATNFFGLRLGPDTTTNSVLLRTTNGIVRIMNGNETLMTALEVLDQAYDATAWNGSSAVPTQNAVRDRIEAIVAGAGTVGTVINTVAVSGLLSVDATKTNGIVATLAHMTNAFGLSGDTSKFINGAGLLTTPAGGGGSSAPTNTLVSVSTPATAGGLFYTSSTVGTNATASAGVTISADTNLTATGTIRANTNIQLQEQGGGTMQVTLQSTNLSASYVLTLPADDGTAGQSLVTDGNGVLSWSTGAGTGDFVGPASSTANAVVAFADSTGKLGRNSLLTVATTTGNVVIGDASQAAITITGNLSGASDPVITLANSQVNIGSSGFVGSSIDVSGSVNGSVTMGGSGVLFANGKSKMYSTTNGYWSMTGQAGTNFYGLRLGPDTTTNSVILRLTNGVLRAMNGDETLRTTMEVIGQPYDATAYDGSLRVVTQDDFRDKIESMSAGSGISGTVINTVAVSGLLSVDATKTNGIAATSAHVTTALGFTPPPNTRSITIAGTANEITSSTGAQDLSADRTWTLSLPAAIDLGGKTSFEIPNGAAPTVNVFGQIAGDNDLWAASRGAPVFYDGTSAVALVGTLVSDTPSNGQVPTWNTGGTITWETPSAGGGGSAPTNTLVSLSTPAVLYSLWQTKDTIGTNATAANISFNDASLVLGTNAAAPVAKLITGSVPTGANTAGANLTIVAPSGTGTGLPGSLILGISPAGSSSSVTNPTVTAITISQDSQISAATATTLAGRLKIPRGTLSLPSIVFSADDDSAGTGIYSPSANVFDISINGIQRLEVESNGVFIPNGNYLAFSSSVPGSSDMFLYRESAATLRMGFPAATPTAQTFKAASGLGTDKLGNDLRIVAGPPTGTAAGGNVSVQTAPSAKSTGSTAQTPLDRFTVVAKGKALTDATAVSLFEVALPTLKQCGGKIEATIVCTDGTDMQSFTQTILFSAVNKGAAYTTDIDVIPTDLVSGLGSKSTSGASTLTTAWTILTGTDKITVQLNADTSLTPSTLSFLVYYTVTNNSEQAITVL